MVVSGVVPHEITMKTFEEMIEALEIDMSAKYDIDITRE